MGRPRTDQPLMAFSIMMELGEPYQTLVFLIAVTGLRISEGLGLKWNDLDYERQMIHLQWVWVGNDGIDRLKTDGSAAPVPGRDTGRCSSKTASDSARCETRGLDFPIHKDEGQNAA